MAQYKVLKELPGASVGSILYSRSEFGNCLYIDKECRKPAIVLQPRWDDVFAQGFVEPYEDKINGWRASLGDEYHAVDIYSFGPSQFYSKETGSTVDVERNAWGNYFASRKTAESVAESLKLLFGYLHHGGIDDKWLDLQDSILDARTAVLEDHREK